MAMGGWSILIGMGNFIKRQAKTKTGKYALGIIVGAIIANNLPPGVTAYVPGIVEQVLSPDVAAGMMGIMFLRDKAARREAQDRGDE